MLDRELAAVTKEIMQVGSKSFSLAATLFTRELRVGARMLYAWCRYCDDRVDIAADPEAKRERVEEIFRQTESALNGEVQNETIFQAFQLVAHKYNIPSVYALDLIRGMEMDIEDRAYENFSDLELYCYHVAGVVGLMMVYIMGISHEKALSNAVDLGIAMQLTNISRDVLDDAELGRCYLPQVWLDEEGIKRSEIANPENRGKVAKVVCRLLDRTEYFYRSGKQGLKFLPFRAAVAVAVAANVYREISCLVLLRGANAWDRRAVVSKPKKLWLTILGIFQVMVTIPSRLIFPWKPCQFQRVWRPFSSSRAWVESIRFTRTN